jgi:hypothetical protein
MTDETKKNLSVVVPVVNDHFSLFFPRACCYCAKPLTEGSDDLRLHHIKGESKSRRQIAPGAPYIVTTRTVEFDIPYCAKHFEENQRNLEMKTHVNATTGIVLFILLFFPVGALCSTMNGETDALVVLTLIGTLVLTLLFTGAITPSVFRFRMKKDPSLKSIDDMLKGESAALTKEALGICVTPYQNIIEVKLTNLKYAKLMVDQNTNAKIIQP